MPRAVREVTVSTVITAPREEIFDFVCDLAARPAFTDHYMRDFRLARVNSVGVGAACPASACRLRKSALSRPLR